MSHVTEALLQASGCRSPEWAESGVDLLCVGEPGPLSPEESERFREDRLRLVWSRDACLVIFRNRDVLFLLRDKRHTSSGEESPALNTGAADTAQVCASHLSCPSLVLVFLFRLAILDLLVVLRAGPTLMVVFSNGYELHHLRVDQPVDRLPVHLGDEVSLPQPRFVGRAAVLHMLRASRGRWDERKKERWREGEKDESNRKEERMEMYLRAMSLLFWCLLPSSVDNKNLNTRTTG
ncbi:hypothetical protein EYF80_015039 [Liparis tanakae]|uniref:Uncharacterized protein n=1 Tax=Liparis tanakae TaxID=230148 RepID=A0A4Z2IAD2_9TELE|nr:hypothetical protein EYF80_015039 [Liparis tanakae]